MGGEFSSGEEEQTQEAKLIMRPALGLGAAGVSRYEK